ncbi:MAG: hypothetical protein AB1697_11590, partial [Pseudomonadota bacterium]
VGVEVKIIPAGTVGTENDRAASQKSCVSAFRKVVIFYEHGFRPHFEKVPVGGVLSACRS